MASKSAVRLYKKIIILGRLKIFNLYILFCSLFGLRPRYFLTHDNKLRLRYLVYIWAGVLGFALINSVSPSPAYAPMSSYPTIEMADSSRQESPEARTARLGGTNENSLLSHPSGRIVPARMVSARMVSALSQEEKKSQNHPALLKIAYTPPSEILKKEKSQSQDIIPDNVRVISQARTMGGITYFLPDHNQVIRNLDPSLDADKIRPLDAPSEPAQAHDHELHQAAVSTEQDSPSNQNEKDLRNPQSESQRDIAQAEQEMHAALSAGTGRVSSSGYPIPPRPEFDLTGVNFTRDIEIRRGDTFAAILHEAGIRGSQAHDVIRAVSKKYNPRHLKIGQNISLDFTLGRVRKDKRLTGLKIPLNEVNTLALKRSGTKDFKADIEEIKLIPELQARKLEINNSLYASALDQDLPIPVFEKVLQIYAWDVDFQRDLRKGDKLEILYEAMTGRDGKVVTYGDVKYASLSVKGRDIPVYHFETDKGRSDYFKKDGKSVRKTLMMTPIDGGRISSRYGMRHHPVLGYSKMHKGVDFAAPVGTPVYAAGDGVVERIGRYGAYGNYIRLRHNNKLKTAYAHLNGYKKGLRKGDKVQQGDVIGYLGNTGRSTGPHLHYEVLVHNKQVRPNSLDLPTGIVLVGNELKRFKSKIMEKHELYARHLGGAKYASLSSFSKGNDF